MCTAFTAPTVPTGMNIGVRISPCAVESTPQRASLFLSFAKRVYCMVMSF